MHECYMYGKLGHKSYQCNQRKGRSDQNHIVARLAPQANIAEDEIIVVVIVQRGISTQIRTFS